MLWQCTYTPEPGTDEHVVFQEMKICMYAVFVDCIKEPCGVNIILNHEQDKDPQAIYADLEHHDKLFQVAVLHVSDRHSAVMSKSILKVHTLSLIKYILAFFNQIHDCSAMVLPASHMSMDTQLTHFKTFIQVVHDLEMMTGNIQIMMTREPISAEGQIEIYKNIARRIDDAAIKN